MRRDNPQMKNQCSSDSNSGQSFSQPLQTSSSTICGETFMLSDVSCSGVSVILSFAFLFYDVTVVVQIYYLGLECPAACFPDVRPEVALGASAL